MFKKLLFSLVLFSCLFLGFSSVKAVELPDPGLIPGNFFYFLKIFFENIRTFFTFGEIAKAERFLFLAELRLAEVKKLIEKDEFELAQRPIIRYGEHIDNVLLREERARNKDLDTQDLLIELSKRTLSHHRVLTEFYDSFPEESKSIIEEVAEKSFDAYSKSLKLIPEEKKEEIFEEDHVPGAPRVRTPEVL